jgi:hypothetical protein
MESAGGLAAAGHWRTCLRGPPMSLSDESEHISTMTLSALTMSVDFPQKSHRSFNEKRAYRAEAVAPFRRTMGRTGISGACCRNRSRPRRCQMTRLLATLATLKSILTAASVAFARGDTCAVVLVSALLSLVQLGTKPATHGDVAGDERDFVESRSQRPNNPLAA